MEGHVLTVEPDALVLLVGPSGAGKTTFAARCFAPDEILSSDVFRALVSGDPADQSATSDAFRLLHIAAHARLRRGRLTVVDATNLLHASRRSLLRVAERFGRPTAAVAFALPLAVCLEWNERRPGRSIPPQVVRRQHALMARSLEHLPREGFGRVLVVRSPDRVADITVARTAPGEPSR